MNSSLEMVHKGDQYAGEGRSDLRGRLEALHAQIQQCRLEINQGQSIKAERGTPPVDPQLVRNYISTLARREEILGSNLFRDPAWELLLEGFAAALNYERLTSSMIGARVKLPATTTSRWLSKLEGDGLLQRVSDPFDARLSLINLTPQAFEGLVRYFTLRSSVVDASERESMNSEI